MRTRSGAGHGPAKSHAERWPPGRCHPGTRGETAIPDGPAGAHQRPVRPGHLHDHASHVGPAVCQVLRPRRQNGTGRAKSHQAAFLAAVKRAGAEATWTHSLLSNRRISDCTGKSVNGGNCEGFRALAYESLQCRNPRAPPAGLWVKRLWDGSGGKPCRFGSAAAGLINVFRAASACGRW